MQPQHFMRLISAACLLNNLSSAEVNLPDCPELDMPTDIKLPEGIQIPNGFEITCDMVGQYLEYLDQNGGEDEAPLRGDKWFKELATAHPNANLQMNVKKVDTASANEESSFKEKFLDTFLSKAVILPTIGIIISIVAVWAFMTKCGQRACCKKEKMNISVADQPKKSVKSDQSNQITASNDLENNSHLSNVISDGSSQGTFKSKINHSNVKTVELEMTAESRVRVSVPTPHRIFEVSSQRSSNRFSNLSAPPTMTANTANRLSLPTVSVPIQHIVSKRSQGSGSDTISIQRPSLNSR